MHEYKWDFLTVLTEHSLIKLIKKPYISKISEDPQTDIDRESAYFYYNGIITSYTHNDCVHRQYVKRYCSHIVL